MLRRILAVDDMAFNRDHLRKVLEAEGYEVETVADGPKALERLRSGYFHLVITDLRMPGFSGLELLATIRAERLPVGLIVLTAFGDPEDALRAMKAGADDFLTKPYDAEHLNLRVKRVLERRQLIDELDLLRKQLEGDYGFQTLVSKNPRMRRVFDLIEQVGPTGSTVLIQGETGTGKELVARAIHAADTKRKGPFIALNCAVLNESLLESELFGHEKGAFTGAERRAIGRFEAADGGALLLDEIGEVAPPFQAKLLRVLQSGEFERVGGSETIRADVRLIAATNKRLANEVRAGRFRSDLYYRLNVILIELPPLRERAEDIPLLAMHFLEKQRVWGSPVSEIETEAMEALVRHPWPGNVRELENAIKGAVALASGSVLRYDDLPDTIAPRSRKRDNDSSLIDIERPLPDLTGSLVGRVEREYFVRLLTQYRGNVAQCARHSGLSRRSVTQKLQKYGLDRSRFRSSAMLGTSASTACLDDDADNEAEDQSPPPSVSGCG
jgi:DNA-binding NtrC family response regulator